MDGEDTGNMGLDNALHLLQKFWKLTTEINGVFHFHLSLSLSFFHLVIKPTTPTHPPTTTTITLPLTKSSSMSLSRRKGFFLSLPFKTRVHCMGSFWNQTLEYFLQYCGVCLCMVQWFTESEPSGRDYDEVRTWWFDLNGSWPDGEDMNHVIIFYFLCLWGAQQSIIADFAVPLLVQLLHFWGHMWIPKLAQHSTWTPCTGAVRNPINDNINSN